MCSDGGRLAPARCAAPCSVRRSRTHCVGVFQCSVSASDVCMGERADWPDLRAYWAAPGAADRAGLVNHFAHAGSLQSAPEGGACQMGGLPDAARSTTSVDEQCYHIACACIFSSLPHALQVAPPHAFQVAAACISARAAACISACTAARRATRPARSGPAVSPRRRRAARTTRRACRRRCCAPPRWTAAP